MAESDPPPVFKLNNSSDRFSAKSNDIFGCLSVIEKKHEAYQKAHTGDEDSSLVKPDPDDEETRTAEKQASRKNCERREASDRNSDRRNRSEFIRPTPPQRFRPYRGRGSRRTPDYKVNPQRWTKYTLDDVDGQDMTESSNTKAAFEFLEERRRLREMETDPESFKAANVEETACSKGAITFVRKKKEISGNSEKVKDIALPRDIGVDVEDCETLVRENLDEEPDTTKEEVKVSFKSKKGKKRNIRSRPSDEDQEDQNSL